MLRIMTLENSNEWDEVVKSFPEHDIYWLSGYVKAFKTHGDGEPLLFYYCDDKTRGINVVMKRDISLHDNFKDVLKPGTLFDFSTPYGYGGWIIEGETNDELFKEYEEWCHNNNIVCEFVRFHPVVNNYKYSVDYYNTILLGKTVTMDLTSKEVIWSNITSKNRNMIRKAIKNGITVYYGRYPQIYDEFRQIYNETMNRDNADSYYYFEPEFYQSVLLDLPQNSMVFYAVYEGKVISAAIMLFENKRMNYHLSGSVREYSNLAPSNLLLYEAALWGSTNGYETLYLGGGVGSGEDSLYKFKKAFNRQEDVSEFYIGKKIFIQEEYDKLLSIRGNIKSDYFPQYRA